MGNGVISRIDETLRERLLPLLQANQAASDLRTYFADDDANGYTGRWFECIGGPGDAPEVANQFTAADIVAVSTLSVQVPAQVSWRLLEKDARELSELLSGIPTDVDLWNATDEHIGTGSSADHLWRRLKGMSRDGGDGGHAWVTAGKLMSRKRPRLIPVYDRMVRHTAALNAESSWWLSLRAALDEDVLTHLRRHQGQGKVPEHVSLLRVLDVVLWRHGKRMLAPAQRGADQA